MDGGEDRCFDQPRVAQWHEVVVAVDEVEFSRELERFGDVQVFGYFGVDGGGLFIPLFHDGTQVSAGHRISGSEQGHIPATADDPLADITSHRLPTAISPRRASPCERREDPHSYFGISHAGDG